MSVLGIVAEYDPFHNGHLYHLTEAVRRVSPDLVFVVLSPCFKQRGELSLLSPQDRARLALEAGADAVFSLPVLWTVRDAEHYALGAVSLLSRLGVTDLAFGAETSDVSLLLRAAGLLEDPSPAFSALLKEKAIFWDLLELDVDAVVGTGKTKKTDPSKWWTIPEKLRTLHKLMQDENSQSADGRE